ncbi:hypothetical protein DITRI_Ditri02bG0141600 [Diplodiscus trichospermus]
MLSICSKWFAGLKSLENYEPAHNGRIWVLWRDAIKVEMVAASDQSMTCFIEYNSLRFLFTALYGSNDGGVKKKFWKHLENLHSSFHDFPWMLAGDFNITISPTDSSNFSEGHAITAKIKDFVDCRNTIAVYDHFVSGPCLLGQTSIKLAFLQGNLIEYWSMAVGIFLQELSFWL